MEEPAQEPAKERLTILMVDDEIVILEAFVDILEDEGYRILTAENGLEALEVLKKEKVDIVVSDIKMPKMDGIQLLQAIREMNDEIPVVMSTAYATLEITISAMRYGASNYLIKPIQIDLLTAVIRECEKKIIMRKENDRISKDLAIKNAELMQLNEAREKLFEDIAQKLRQPLIDQQSWSELLLTDTEESLSKRHIDKVSGIHRTSTVMLNDVLAMLDSDKVKEKLLENQDSLTETESGIALDESVAPEEIKKEEAPAPAPIVALKQKEPTRHDFKILLVVHSPVLRDTLEGVLWRKYSVFSANDGKSALELIQEKPDLIIVELDLPRINGAQMYSALLQHEINIPVIAFCEKDSVELIAQAKKAKIEHILPRPFHITELLKKVESYVPKEVCASRKKVLYYSANSDERCLIQRLFGGRYNTLLASNLEECENLLKENPDVFILDYAEGFDDLLELKKQCQQGSLKTKVLVLTDNLNKETLLDLKQKGIASVMLKPFYCVKLLERVRELLGHKDQSNFLSSVYIQMS